MTDQLKDGIYFGLPFEQYLLQKRMSASGVRKMNKGPLVYWEDVIAPTLEPDYDPLNGVQEDTKAQFEGKAWHTMMLEGPDVFWSRYAIEFDLPAWKEANPKKFVLVTKDDYLDALDTLGITGYKTSETKPKLKARIDAFKKKTGEDTYHFLDDLKAKNAFENEGKELLTQVQWEELSRANDIFEAYGIRDTFINSGFPEVSILFTMKDVKYRARLDYLRYNSQIEYKTVANKYQKMLDEAAVDQIHNEDYFNGSYLYQKAVEWAQKALHSHKGGFGDLINVISGDGPSEEWVDAFVKNESHKYWFIIQERGKYNHIIARSLPKYDAHRKITSMWRTGQMRVERAVKLHTWFMENVGPEHRWLPNLNPKAFDDSDFKIYHFEEGA